MDSKSENTGDVRAFLENLSAQDFKNFGLHQIGYVRREISGETTRFKIYAADGEFLTSAGNLGDAVKAAKSNDIEPVTVH